MGDGDKIRGDNPTPSANKASKLYEPKKAPKVIRVLTVLAYILSVSLAAIFLSLYYVLMWDSPSKMPPCAAKTMVASGTQALNPVAEANVMVPEATTTMHSSETLMDNVTNYLQDAVEI